MTKKTSVFDELDPWVDLEAHISRKPDGLWIALIVDPIAELVHTCGVLFTEEDAVDWAVRCLDNLSRGLPEPADLGSTGSSNLLN